MQLTKYSKSITTFVIGALNVLALYVSLKADGTFSALDQQVVIYAVITWLGGTGAVWAVKNK